MADYYNCCIVTQHWTLAAAAAAVARASGDKLLLQCLRDYLPWGSKGLRCTLKYPGTTGICTSAWVRVSVHIHLCLSFPVCLLGSMYRHMYAGSNVARLRIYMSNQISWLLWHWSSMYITPITGKIDPQQSHHKCWRSEFIDCTRVKAVCHGCTKVQRVGSKTDHASANPTLNGPLN